MTSELLRRAAQLSDRDLVSRVTRLAAHERASTVELVAHLGELDARKLHVAEGHGSLFTYCTRVLRLAEHAAYNRIEAARLCRRFPRVLDLLAEGALNLSTLRLIGPHLLPETFDSLTRAANGRSKREVEVMVAGLAPRPDVRASVRRLPARPRDVGRGANVAAGSAVAPAAGGADAPAPGRSGIDDPPRGPAADEVQSAALLEGRQALVDGGGHAVASRPLDRPVVTALAPQRFRVQFTIGTATHDKLRQAQDLLRREIPDGDPGAIFDRALTLLLEDVARKKLALSSRPRANGRGTKHGGNVPLRRSRRGRHIPAHVKRAVWLRDGARCAFAAGGRRCSERAFLEFHHCEPHGVGGEASVRNISLRCRAHNVYEAELFFGPGVCAPRGSRPAHRGPGHPRPPSDAGRATGPPVDEAWKLRSATRAVGRGDRRPGEASGQGARVAAEPG